MLVREQEGTEVDGCEVHLYSWIHQEYTFRHRSACKTPTERGWKYLTRGEKYREPRKTQ